MNRNTTAVVAPGEKIPLKSISLEYTSLSTAATGTRSTSLPAPCPISGACGTFEKRKWWRCATQQFPIARHASPGLPMPPSSHAPSQRIAANHNGSPLVAQPAELSTIDKMAVWIRRQIFGLPALASSRRHARYRVRLGGSVPQVLPEPRPPPAHAQDTRRVDTPGALPNSPPRHAGSSSLWRGGRKRELRKGVTVWKTG